MCKRYPLVFLLLISLNVWAQNYPSSVDNMAQALRFPTVSNQQASAIDVDAFFGFLGFLEASYPTIFSQLQIEKISKYSLLMTWLGSDQSLQPVLFDAHYDVVPIEPGTEFDWSHPPFAGVIADSYLWGRGAVDDKLAVIATLEALERLLIEGHQPNRTLLFSIVHDEEIGGNNGAAKVAQHLKDKGIQLAYMIGEGGLLIDGHPLLSDRLVAMVGLAEKTYLTLTLTTTGDGGHSSFPPENNAAVRVARAVTALHENPFDAGLEPPVTDMLASFAPYLGGVTGFLFNNQWLSESLLLWQMSKERSSNAMIRTTTAVTMFNAGIKENVVPQQASAKVNFRLLPSDTPEQVIERVTAIINDPQITISAQSWKKSPPVSSVDTQGYKAISAAIKKVFPEVVVAPSLLIATTDTGHYADLTKNIYRFHPYRMHIDDSSGIHGTNERIAVQSIIDGVAVSKSLITAASE